MPSAPSTARLPSSHPATRTKPKSPNRVLADAEAQWLFTEAELANTPSIQDGMTESDERELRAKGVDFIVKVGIMLKLPQLTLSTAAIFFQRFLMRASLKKERNGIPKLHHYQAAATALFLATKVEESCRKMRELILAFCRVAQKNQNLQIDEQSKDWWRWRDCILFNEDVLLETLCFDLTVESPHRQLFDLLKHHGLEHNKRLRNSAWSFVTDANNTQLCLLCTSRTIAVAALYAACRYCNVAIADDSDGRAWWEIHSVQLKDIKTAVNYMTTNYEASANKLNAANLLGTDGDQSIHQSLSTPMDGVINDETDVTRLRADQHAIKSPAVAPSSERRNSNASSIGMKREREEDTLSLQPSKKIANGGRLAIAEDGLGIHKLGDEDKENEASVKGKLVANNEPVDLLHREEVLQVKNGDRKAEAIARSTDQNLPKPARDTKPEPAADAQASSDKEDGEASEEGQVEE